MALRTPGALLRLRGWAAFSNSVLRRLGCCILATVGFCSVGTWANTDLQLQLLQSQYLSDTQNRVQSDAYSSFGVRLKHQNAPESRMVHGLDLLGLASADGTEQAYVAAPEFYWGLNANIQKLPGKLILGRKRFAWSHFDEEWNLGIWQPYVRWDYLHPLPQGLSGAFLSLGEEGPVQVTAFATPFFLPDQGPQFEVIDGQFNSSNRWFRQPTNKHMVINQDRRLNYELDRPSEGDVVMNAGYGLSVLVGSEKEGPWFKASLADKPINQMHIGIEGYHSIARLNRFLESVAVVHPVVARHNVMTLEAGYSAPDFFGWISLTEERPKDPQMPDEWEEASLYASRFIGMTLSHRLPWQGWRSHWLKYGAMTMSERLPPERLDDPEDNLESSLDRYPFREVLSFEWTAPFVNRASHRLDFGLRYLYSVPEKGSLLSAKLELMWRRNTRWDLGVDVLGTEGPSSVEDRGLMSLYRNNDRVMGGMTYVF
ncbi:MAG: hypothetical protein AB7K41_09515 [Bdellovibrionales bacterium]